MELKELPVNVQIGLTRYVKHHIPPGSFLRAVLENNLSEAVANADERNLVEIKKIVQYVYNEVPANCWGSHEVVRKWIVQYNPTTEVPNE